MWSKLGLLLMAFMAPAVYLKNQRNNNMLFRDNYVYIKHQVKGKRQHWKCRYGIIYVFLMFSHSFAICCNWNYLYELPYPSTFLETSVIFISGLFSHPFHHSHPRYVSIAATCYNWLSLQLYIFQIFSCPQLPSEGYYRGGRGCQG